MMKAMTHLVNTSARPGRAGGSPAREGVCAVQVPAWSQSKRATARCIGWAVERLDANCLHFVTLTFAEDLAWSEVQRRWSRLQMRFLRNGIGPFVGVWEQTQKGRWHLHLIGEIRPAGWSLHGVFAGRSYRPAPTDSAVWARWRKLMDETGWGRCQVTRVRSPRLAARYVAKYLVKGLWERGRRVTWPGWSKSRFCRPTTRHSLVGGASQLYRLGRRFLRVLPGRRLTDAGVRACIVRGAEFLLAHPPDFLPADGTYWAARRLIR